MRKILISAPIALFLLTAAQSEKKDRWDEYNGQPAPRLVAAAWSGTPVSLEAVRGNTVVLAFWNADVPC